MDLQLLMPLDPVKLVDMVISDLKLRRSHSMINVARNEDIADWPKDNSVWCVVEARGHDSRQVDLGVANTEHVGGLVIAYAFPLKTRGSSVDHALLEDGMAVLAERTALNKRYKVLKCPAELKNIVTIEPYLTEDKSRQVAGISAVFRIRLMPKS